MPRTKKRLRISRPKKLRLPPTQHKLTLTTVSKQITLHPLSPIAACRNGAALSDVEFEIPGFIGFDSNIRAIRINLVQASFPVSFYFINDTNNKLHLSRGENDDFLFEAPFGSYGAIQYVKYFTQHRDDFVKDNPDRQDMWGHVELEYNEHNGKFTLIWESNGINPMIIKHETTTSRDIIGLDDFNNKDLVLPKETQSFAFPMLVDMLGPYSILICSDAFPIKHYDTRTRKNYLYNIPIGSRAFEVFYYQTTMGDTFSLSNSFTLNKIDLQLFDDKGNFLHFNGVPWTIVIQFDIDYAVDANWQSMDMTVVDSFPKDIPL